jgi:hypothetical protein
MTDVRPRVPAIPADHEAPPGAATRLPRAAEPREGWTPWLKETLTGILVGGVRSGQIDADLARDVAEHFVDCVSPDGLVETVEAVHDLAHRFPWLGSSLDAIRAGILEFVEPRVAEIALSELRRGRTARALAATQRYLELAERYLAGRVAPARFVTTLAAILEGDRE